MKQTYDFEQFTPPMLNEELLRRELEKRAERRRTVLLAIAGALLQLVLVLLGLLCAGVFPVLGLGCICTAIVSTAGGGAIAIIYTQKGEAGYECW